MWSLFFKTFFNGSKWRSKKRIVLSTALFILGYVSKLRKDLTFHPKDFINRSLFSQNIVSTK